MEAPESRMAARAPWSSGMRSATTSPKSLSAIRATAPQSARSAASRAKARGGASAVRRAAMAANASGVGMATPGCATSTARSGSGGTASRRSPLPHASASGEPHKKNGTSLPSSMAICRSAARSNGSPWSTLRARSVAAASELPPPRPAAAGMRFTRRMATAGASPSRAWKRWAARTARLRSGGPMSAEPSTVSATPGASRRTVTSSASETAQKSDSSEW